MFVTEFLLIPLLVKLSIAEIGGLVLGFGLKGLTTSLMSRFDIPDVRIGEYVMNLIPIYSTYSLQAKCEQTMMCG